jgi:hypothetical protein
MFMDQALRVRVTTKSGIDKAAYSNGKAIRQY